MNPSDVGEVEGPGLDMLRLGGVKGSAKVVQSAQSEGGKRRNWLVGWWTGARATYRWILGVARSAGAAFGVWHGAARGLLPRAYSSFSGYLATLGLSKAPQLNAARGGQQCYRDQPARWDKERNISINAPNSSSARSSLPAKEHSIVQQYDLLLFFLFLFRFYAAPAGDHARHSLARDDIVRW